MRTDEEGNEAATVYQSSTHFDFTETSVVVYSVAGDWWRAMPRLQRFDRALSQ